MANLVDTSVQTVISATDLELPKPIIRFDPEYIKTLPGSLKVAEVVFCLLGLICIQTMYMATYHSSGGWYYFVSMTGFWISGFFLVSYVFHIAERCNGLPWLAAEMVYSTVWFVFYFIAACVSAIRGKEDPAWVAAASLGFVVMLVYAFEAFIKYKKWRRGDVAQGERQTSSADLNVPSIEAVN